MMPTICIELDGYWNVKVYDHDLPVFMEKLFESSTFYYVRWDKITIQPSVETTTFGVSGSRSQISEMSTKFKWC